MQFSSYSIKKSLLFSCLLSFIVFVNNTYSQTCSSCTVTLSNANQYGNITIANGQTYCIPNGVTFQGTINLQAGGTLCIASGGNFGPFPNVTGFNGTVNNYGNINFAFYSTNTPTINNFGNMTTPGMQGFAGILNNSGTVNLNGYFTFVSGSSINNSGTINKSSSGEFTNVTVTNSGTLNMNQSFFLNGGSLTNTMTGTAN